VRFHAIERSKYIFKTDDTATRKSVGKPTL
jgi:hypothetical protein